MITQTDNRDRAHANLVQATAEYDAEYEAWQTVYRPARDDFRAAVNARRHRSCILHTIEEMAREKRDAARDRYCAAQRALLDAREAAGEDMQDCPE